MDTKILPALRKKRSHVKGLITKQGSRLADWVSSRDRDKAVEELQGKLKSLADERGFS